MLITKPLENFLFKSFFRHRKKIIIFVFLFNNVFSIAQILSPNTTGSFTYIPTAPLNTKPVEVFYHIPTGDINTMPILFSFHGASRNGADYRDFWISMADANGFMVFAPEFSHTYYPTGDQYQSGNIFDDGDNPSLATYNPINEWTFSIIDPLFEYIKADVSSIQEVYNAWGHSGGAQFLHRFVEYMPNSKLDIAVCSNSGWYTVPEYTYNFPYGLNEGQLSNETLTDAFSKKLIVHLGLDDIDPNSAGLRHNIVVDTQQGLYRLARGRYFFNTSQTTSLSMSVPFNWEKHEITGIGHDAQLMANDALQFILNSILSNQDYLTSKSFNIYPNPTSSNSVKFSTNLNTPISVSVFNILGEEIVKKLIEDRILNISDLIPGIYLIKIQSDTFSTTKKLIKK